MSALDSNEQRRPTEEIRRLLNGNASEQRDVLRAKRGLSDPAQALFRHEQDFLRRASEYEKPFAIEVRTQNECLRCRTPLSDVVTTFRTFRALFPSKASEDGLAIHAQIRSTTDSEATDKSGSALRAKNKGA